MRWFLLRTLAAFASLCCAQSQASASAWLPGTNAWGAHGARWVNSAAPAPDNELTLAVTADFYEAANILNQGDVDSGQTYGGHLLWVPTPGLQIGGSGTFILNVYETFGTYAIRTLGNPALRAQYTREWWPHIAAGLLVQGQMPTSSQTGAVQPAAIRVDMTALASYHLSSYLDVSANLGYTIDNSRKEFSSPPAPERRFVLGISDFNTFHLGLAGQALWRFLPAFAGGAFAEFTGTSWGGAPEERATLRSSFGVKAFGPYDKLELALGVDVRILGAPTPEARFAGLPPWQGFVVVRAHLFPGAAEPSPLACRTDADCDGELVCDNNVCVKFRQTAAARGRLDTFTVEGYVLDANKGGGVARATVLVLGYGDAVLPVDEAGKFASFPITMGPQGVTLRFAAPGYDSQDVVVASGKQGETKSLSISLHPTAYVPSATLKGQVADRRTGKPLAGCSVFIPILAKKTTTDSEGAFTVSAPPGQYDLLIAFKHYSPQRRRIVLEDKDVVEINIAMTPGSRR